MLSIVKIPLLQPNNYNTALLHTNLTRIFRGPRLPEGAWTLDLGELSTIDMTLDL